MPRNGAGAYSLPNAPVVNGQTLTDVLWNSQFSDIATELTNSLPRDGQAPPTANLPMGGFKLTNLALGTARTDSATLGQVQDAGTQWCGTAGGTANALTLAPTPSPSAYAAGQRFTFKSGAAGNSAATTVNVAALGAKAIQVQGRACVGGEILANQWYEILYDGAAFQLSDINGRPVADDGPIVANATDFSKRLRILLSALTTAVTRSWTAPDYDLRVGNLPAGVIMDYAGSSVPTGWLECDGSAVSRTTYAALFTAISTTWGAGDGSTTFNLPDFRGRARIGRGTGTATAAGSNADVDTTNDTLTVATNTDKWITGMAVLFTLSSGTITGLTSGVTYYIVRNNTTTVKLASSLANAQNGTVIDMTAKSSPVWTITHTLTARTLADQGGEQSHAMSSTELLSHTHAGGYLRSDVGGATGPAAGTTAFGQSIPSTGGNAAMNNMQPYAATMTIISY